MVWTALQRGHLIARIPEGAFGKPGLSRTTLATPWGPRSAPSANDWLTLRFSRWPINAATTPHITQKTMIATNKVSKRIHWCTIVSNPPCSHAHDERIAGSKPSVAICGRLPSQAPRPQAQRVLTKDALAV